ncbi:phage portal protein [Emticicia agri]|uniref:Phage portal protein n=1 Tax=Emticicia agri TaxID=2492393 RepID=A0A4Q5LVT5_9BACT|nr:phage portal protein [Emticicia agri]RYU93846.1 phage portal protein [Emticicia agri]
MKIFEITETDDIEASVKFFRDATEQPPIEVLKTQYQVAEHPVFDLRNRPDRKVLKEDGSFERWDAVNRLGLPIQKKIVGASVAFLFGNPVKLSCQTRNQAETQVLELVKKILYANKIDSFNRRIARDLFRATAVAEVWFAVGESSDEKHTDYGFETPYRIKVMKLSPWDGNELYPYFDKYGNMTAFCRAYRLFADKKEVAYFEVYTNEEYKLFEKTDDGWQEIESSINSIGKIPVVYAREEQSDWADVQTAIERLEHLLSNFADTNDYHGNPKIFIEGEIEGFVKKGESGAIIQGEKGAKASYLSWDHAPESIRLEIETLFRVIYSFTQTPDISFDTLKDLKQGISGVALEMLFMDAHLKVQEKREIFDEYLQRRTNILKAYIGWLKPDLKTPAAAMDIQSDITPYLIHDMDSVVRNMKSANGGKALISQRTAIEKSGLVANAEAELKQIKAEEEIKMSDR